MKLKFKVKHNDQTIDLYLAWESCLVVNRIQIHTRECVDVYDCVLTRLVVNDDVDAEERNPKRFPKRFTQFPNDIIIRWLGNTFYVVSLSKMQTKEKCITSF